jgi:hypothetical protein
MYPYNKWKPQELTLANKFNSVFFMDSTEKEILYYSNLVRINPKLFCNTFLQEYIDLKHLDVSNSYVSSLIFTLNNSKPRNELNADSNLFEMAKFHAISMGEKGKVGHDGFENRSKKYLNGKFGPIGENCSYGEERAVDIFMSLLIDEDITSLGHRENILTANFTSIGISIQPHKKYGVNCVMDFGFDISLYKRKTFIQKLLFWKN